MGAVILIFTESTICCVSSLPASPIGHTTPALLIKTISSTPFSAKRGRRELTCSTSESRARSIFSKKTVSRSVANSSWAGVKRREIPTSRWAARASQKIENGLAQALGNSTDNYCFHRWENKDLNNSTNLLACWPSRASFCLCKKACSSTCWGKIFKMQGQPFPGQILQHLLLVVGDLVQIQDATDRKVFIGHAAGRGDRQWAFLHVVQHFFCRQALQ